MTTKLSILNSALLECGERNLASLTEAREPRRLLDAVWDNGALDFCLNAGQWKFATRSTMLERSPSITPAFGYQNAYEIPSDFIRTVAFCADEYFNSPITQYSTEAGFWFSDVEPVYVKYVSNDASYGADMSLWPQNFARYVEAYLASRIIERLSQNETKWGNLFKLTERRLLEAKATDAIEGSTKFAPTGSWVRSRSGSFGGIRHSQNKLIG